jgi:hypothetical protein
VVPGEAEAWVRGHRARGGLICGCGQEGASLHGSNARTACHPIHVHTSVSRHDTQLNIASLRAYLCLLKSWGRSRGPSGTFARPRPAALLFIVGSGRAAVMALEALVLRSRLPWSLVFWNLRTRSSAGTVLAPTPRYASSSVMGLVPEEVLESSDMVDPDRIGTLACVDSMARVVVRGCVDMIRPNAARLAQHATMQALQSRELWWCLPFSR